MIDGKYLKECGLPEGAIYGEILSFVNELGIHRKTVKSLLKDLIKNPSHYLENKNWGNAAKLLSPKVDAAIQLNENGCPTNIYGKHMIEQGALDQINIASRLPVSLQASCMPDGHQGYGLPIGGALATNNVVIPFAVGYDIGCRMHMTITDMPASKMEGLRGHIRNALLNNTVFGVGQNTEGQEHEVLDDDRFTISNVKNLKTTAENQIGSSGSGNHFVNIGSVISEEMGITEPMMAIVSHSGSRGLGHNIATAYIEIAMKECILPKEAKNLAWLSLDSEAGQEYWEAMNLAGDYAKACHEIIHRRLIKAFGVNVATTIQNHHNFAWKEIINVNGFPMEAIVHRKGATPASIGDLGIIPGSMSTPTYIVEGLGNPDSIFSSSHGAGRLMSRKQAKESFTMSDMKKDLLDKGVELIGGDLDECTNAYKSIDLVMAEQKDLVRIKGAFSPWMVRMADKKENTW